MRTPVAWKIHTYAQLESTQDYVRDIAEDEEFFAEGVVVQCLTQTKGRGRHGNQWQSPVGNLYMSLLLRPECDARIAGQLSFVVAVALSAAMDEVIAPGHDKKLKWPNDILIDGKKTAGILLESSIDKLGRVEYVVAGIGVNVMAAPEGAAALQQVSKGPQVPIHPFRDIVLGHISARYRHWQGGGFADIRGEWLAQGYGLGQPMTARLPDRREEGVFEGLDDDGALLLRHADGGTLKISAGEVFFGARQDFT
jgi:BirA family biotin operon repressor/biotin-[acetyl-CoA-carboxylase] ligase